MTYEQLVETVERTIERQMFAPHEFPLSDALREKYLITARKVIEELQFAKPKLVASEAGEWVKTETLDHLQEVERLSKQSSDLAFRYAVRAALGMNDKCGLTGLEKDVFVVHALALRLRQALKMVMEHIEGPANALSLAETEARAALADAQFPRLWG